MTQVVRVSDICKISSEYSCMLYPWHRVFCIFHFILGTGYFVFFTLYFRICKT